MSRFERAFTIFYWLFMAAYIPCFFLFMPRYPHIMIPLHIFGMLLGIPMLIIVFRDLYKRDFADPNSKVTWTLLMLLFWPSILVYLWKHGFHPRSPAVIKPYSPQDNAPMTVTGDEDNPYLPPTA